MKTIRPLVSLVMIASTGLAGADMLHMQNGSVLVGTLVRAERDTVIFNTPFAGDLKVAKKNIERIVTDEAVVLMLENGTVYRDRRIDAGEEELVAVADGEDPVTFALTDIESINPEPWQLGEGYKWTGTIKVSAEFERGNSDTDEWDVSGETVWRSLKDRYTLEGDVERDLKSGNKTSNNWELKGKYDRFSERDPRNYWGGRARFEYDEFQDLDLRITAGPHIGRQFLDTARLSLFGDVGPVWVDERFDEADDNNYLGALWVLRATSDIIGFGSDLYTRHDGLFNTEDPDELILNTTVGIKIPLAQGFETGFEAKWEYDGGAVDDVEELEETYKLFVGYAW
jgi:hypothetical protein